MHVSAHGSLVAIHSAADAAAAWRNVRKDQDKHCSDKCVKSRRVRAFEYATHLEVLECGELCTAVGLTEINMATLCNTASYSVRWQLSDISTVILDAGRHVVFRPASRW